MENGIEDDDEEGTVAGVEGEKGGREEGNDQKFWVSVGFAAIGIGAFVFAVVRTRRNKR